MDTYGDMITLILTFFILLFSMSSVDADKWKQLVQSVTGGVSAIAEPMDPGPPNYSDPVLVYASDKQGVVDASTGNPVDPKNGKDTPAMPPKAGGEDGELNSTTMQQFMELYEKLVNYIEENNMQDMVEAIRSNRLISIRFNESLFFRSGKADVLPEALETLDMLVPFFERYQNIISTISVEGHTDNVPISNSQFKDNWWLSYHRSGNVVDYLIHNTNLDPGMLLAKGYGEYKPIASNDTVEGRAKNRRVQFVIQGIDETEPAGISVQDFEPEIIN